MGQGLVAAGAVVALAGTAAAEPLGLELFPEPVLMAALIDVEYSSSSDALTADGFSTSFNTLGPGVPLTIDSGQFDLFATVDAAGVTSGGSFVIRGAIPSLGFNAPSTTLLTGTIADFGFEPGVAGSSFEFLFDVTGGVLNNTFNASQVGLILNDTGFKGSFDQSFDNLIGGAAGTGSGFAELGVPIPAPGAAGLLLAAGVMASRRRR
jgi:hypothetical protein